jgi:chemotaxis protein methyltransferase CheR
MLLHAEARAVIERGVGPRVAALGLADESRYLEHLQRGDDSDEISRFLDAVSTGFTSFMRDPVHFEVVTRTIRAWADQGQTRFRAWSAASASGEEPYTLAMTLADTLGPDLDDWKVLATDVSAQMIQRADQGQYREGELAPLTSDLVARYFEGPMRGSTGQVTRRVKESLKRRLTFRRLNLASTPYLMQGPLDLIFCRNVMFYLTQPVQQAVVREAERLLRPGGLLFLGLAETLQAVETTLIARPGSVFEKPRKGDE